MQSILERNQATPEDDSTRREAVQMKDFFNAVRDMAVDHET